MKRATGPSSPANGTSAEKASSPRIKALTINRGGHHMGSPPRRLLLSLRESQNCPRMARRVNIFRPVWPRRRWLSSRPTAKSPSLPISPSIPCIRRCRRARISKEKYAVKAKTAPVRTNGDEEGDRKGAAQVQNHPRLRRHGRGHGQRRRNRARCLGTPRIERKYGGGIYVG